MRPMLLLALMLAGARVWAAAPITSAKAGRVQIQLNLVLIHVPPGTARVLDPETEGAPDVIVEDKVGKPGVVGFCLPPDKLKVLRYVVEARQSDGVARTLASPRLVLTSGEPGSYNDGVEQAVPVPKGLGQVGVQFEEFGTRLTVLPTVQRDGRIRLEVEPEVSVPTGKKTTFDGVVVQPRDYRHVRAVTRMRPGHTLVLCGLPASETVTRKHAVPYLSDLPAVGDLFRWETTREEEYEMLILVTPHVIK